MPHFLVTLFCVINKNKFKNVYIDFNCETNSHHLYQQNIALTYSKKCHHLMMNGHCHQNCEKCINYNIFS